MHRCIASLIIDGKILHHAHIFLVTENWLWLSTVLPTTLLALLVLPPLKDASITESIALPDAVLYLDLLRPLYICLEYKYLVIDSEELCYNLYVESSYSFSLFFSRILVISYKNH